MEAIIYLLDLLATVLLLYWALQDADNPSKAPLFSVLRYKEVLKPRMALLKGMIAAAHGVGPGPQVAPPDRQPLAASAQPPRRGVGRGAPRADGWTDPPRRAQRRIEPGR